MKSNILQLENLNKRWFNWQQLACPFFLGPCFTSVGKKFRENFGFPFFTSIAYFRNDEKDNLQGSWLLRIDEGKTTGTYLHDLFTHGDYGKGFLDEFSTLCKKIEEKSISSGIADLASNDLIEDYRRFIDLFTRFYMLGSITEPVQWTGEDVLSIDLLKERLPKESILRGWDSDRIRKAIFSLPRQQYIHKIENSLSECVDVYIALSAGKNNYSEAVEKFYKKNQEFKSKVDNHLEIFYWKNNNYYSAKRVTMADVFSEILENTSGTTNKLKEQLNKTETNLKVTLGDRKVLVRELDDYSRVTLSILDDFGSGLADTRKNFMLMALDILEQYAFRLSEITSISIDTIKMAMPQEIDPILKDPKTYEPRLEERKKGFAMLESPFVLDQKEFSTFRSKENLVLVPKREITTYSEGGDLEYFFSDLQTRFHITNNYSTQEIRGQVAYRPEGDYVEGNVKIVMDPNRDEISNGDILVATSTTPDFMNSIRKCSAIITDYSGAATHAALTSYELQIPCIIGTGNATSILKDGMKVKMNMQSGKIDIIQVESYDN